MKLNFRRKNPMQIIDVIKNTVALLVILVFATAMLSPTLSNDESNVLASLTKPPATPTPDPLIVENEIIRENQQALLTEHQEVKSENMKLNEYINVSRGSDRKTKEVVDYSKLSAPRYIVELIERMCIAHGIETAGEIYSIVGLESNFNPACHNTNGENSRGLLQVNVADPHHAKRNPNKTKLFDPAYNLDYQLNELKDYYWQGRKKGLNGIDLIVYIEKYGQRPKWKDSLVITLKKYYTEWQNATVRR